MTILQRITRKDRTAVVECINLYGSLIWAIARKFTSSTKEAEQASRVIFLDIWQQAGRFDKAGLDEPVFITAIAFQRLSKYSDIPKTI